MRNKKIIKSEHLLLFFILCTSINLFSQISFAPPPSFFRTARELPIISIATTQTIRVEDYGATINDSSDDTNAIANAFKYAADNSTTSNPIEVLFQQGTYHVSGLTGDTHTFTVSGANNIVINGNNAEILLDNPRVGFLKVASSENIIVKNVTIDYKTLPFTQGKVVAVNKAENYFELEIDEGFPMLNVDHLRFAPQVWGMLKNADGNIKEGAPNLFSPRNNPFQFLRPKTFKYNLINSDIQYVAVGDRFVHIGRYNAKTIFNTTNSKQVTYMGITSYTSPAGTYNAFGSSELNILNCKIMIKPNSGRLHSANADCIHISGGFTGPWVQGCEFSGYSDDAMNLKHTRREIKSVVSPTEIILESEVKIGDVLRFFNPRAGLPIGTATVTATQKLSANQFKASLSSPVNITTISEHQLGDKCYIDTRSNESFVIRNNSFKNARRYGLLLQSTYGVVENNLFENLSTGGITISNGVDWGEGFAVNQIKIDGNTFNNCGYDKSYLEDYQAAAITIKLNKLGTPCNASTNFCGEQPSTWQGHRNITIANNVISYNKKALHIENVDTALISSNTISPNPTFSGSDLGDVILNNNANIHRDIYVSSSGNNTATGTSNNPYATISFAISKATSGDTIFVVGTVREISQITIDGKDLTFQGQSNAIIERQVGASAPETGRIINVSGTTNLTFKDITFQNAHAAFQGSVLNTTSNNANLTFERCLFQNNVGTVQNGSVLHFGNADVSITKCTFYNNSATASNGRGAVLTTGGSFTIEINNSTFYQNKLTANTEKNDGAAIKTFNSTSPQQLTITNSLFYDNTDGDGDKSDIACAPSSNLTLVNSLAEYVIEPTTFVNTNSKTTADFSNTTFSFVSPNVQFTAANALEDDTPIDYGNDNNDLGAWDSKINIFEGTSNLSWSDNTNWSSGSAPVGDGTENIAIIGGNCNMFTAGVAINNIKITKELRIQNQNVFIVNGESILADGGFVRYFASLQDNADNTKAWYFVSSPVTGEVFDTAFADRNDITFGSGTNRAIASYNPGETGNAAWTYFSNTNNNIVATPGQGFSMKITPDDITFAAEGGEYANNLVGFEGDFNTDDVTINTSTTGYNLLGNPYTAHINSATFLGAPTSTHIDQSQIWIWNQTSNGGAGNYEVKTSGEAFILAPAQGFFVNVNTAGSVNFAESNQATTGGTFQKSGRTELKLSVSDHENSRFTKLYFLDNATKGYDFGWEGEVFGGVENDVALYTNLINENQGKKYQVQSLPKSEIEHTIIPLGVHAEVGKELTFSLEALNFPTKVKVYLEDRLHNTFHKISDSAFKISLSESLNNAGRFFIHTKTEGILSTNEEAVLKSISIYKASKTSLKIEGLPNGNATVKLFTMLGKKVLETSFVSKVSKEISLPNLSRGVYLIHLETKRGKLNKKIIID